MRTSSPVSSATSRSAVCSSVSPGFGVPLGSVQVLPSRSRRRRPATSCGTPAMLRMTIPPAEVAVARLSRATAPTRRARDDRGSGRSSFAQRTATSGPAIAGRRAWERAERDHAPVGAQQDHRPEVRPANDRRAVRRGLEADVAMEPEAALPESRRGRREADRRTNREPRGEASLHVQIVPRQRRSARSARRRAAASGARPRRDSAIATWRREQGPIRRRAPPGAASLAARPGGPRPCPRRRGPPGPVRAAAMPSARALPSACAASGP